MKLINNVILKHLATAYVVANIEFDRNYCSFEEYCNKYSNAIKQHGDMISDVIKGANHQMKREKVIEKRKKVIKK